MRKLCPTLKWCNPEESGCKVDVKVRHPGPIELLWSTINKILKGTTLLFGTETPIWLQWPSELYGLSTTTTQMIAKSWLRLRSVQRWQCWLQAAQDPKRQLSVMTLCVLSLIVVDSSLLLTKMPIQREEKKGSQPANRSIYYIQQRPKKKRAKGQPGILSCIL